MNFSRFLLILRARRLIVLVTLVITVVSTVGVSLLLPKTYKATASVLLNYKGIDPITGLTMPGQLLPGYMATQIDIISSKNVALRVVDQLKLAQSPAVIAQFNDQADGKGTVRDWLADLLLKKLEIVPSRESSVVEISFKAADPAFGAAVANAFSEEYQKISIQLRVEPIKKVSGYFNEQTKLLRDRVEVAQARLSKYQQEKGIVSLDNRLDVELGRLNELSGQLVGAQGQRMEATSRKSMAQGSNAANSPDVNGNPLVQSLKATLAGAEAKLAETGQRLGHNHPQYESQLAEVERFRAELSKQTAVTANSLGSNAAVLSSREGGVRAALEAQKTRVLELNRDRDELNVLLKDVESAQRAFDVTSQRFSQTRIEGEAEQSDIAVLKPAVPPIDHSSPKIMLNTVLSVFLGTMLGLGFAMLAEMLDRRVRSDSDLSDALNIPVFGSVDWNASKRPVSRVKALLSPRRLRLN